MKHEPRRGGGRERGKRRCARAQDETVTAQTVGPVAARVDDDADTERGEAATSSISDRLAVEPPGLVQDEDARLGGDCRLE